MNAIEAEKLSKEQFIVCEQKYINENRERIHALILDAYNKGFTSISSNILPHSIVEQELKDDGYFTEYTRTTRFNPILFHVYWGSSAEIKKKLEQEPIPTLTNSNQKNGGKKYFESKLDINRRQAT